MPFSRARRAALSFGLALVFVPGAQADASDSLLSKVGVSRAADGRAVVRITGTRAPDFVVYDRERPFRVIIDWAGSRLAKRLQLPDPMSGFVRRVRARQVRAEAEDISRVVIELAQETSYFVSTDGSQVDVLIRVPRGYRRSQPLARNETPAVSREPRDAPRPETVSLPLEPSDPDDTAPLTEPLVAVPDELPALGGVERPKAVRAVSPPTPGPPSPRPQNASEARKRRRPPPRPVVGPELPPPALPARRLADSGADPAFAKSLSSGPLTAPAVAVPKEPPPIVVSRPVAKASVVEAPSRSTPRAARRASRPRRTRERPVPVQGPELPPPAPPAPMPLALVDREGGPGGPVVEPRVEVPREPPRVQVQRPVPGRESSVPAVPAPSRPPRPRPRGRTRPEPKPVQGPELPPARALSAGALATVLEVPPDHAQGPLSEPELRIPSDPPKVAVAAPKASKVAVAAAEGQTARADGQAAMRTDPARGARPVRTRPSPRPVEGPELPPPVRLNVEPGPALEEAPLAGPLREPESSPIFVEPPKPAMTPEDTEREAPVPDTLSPTLRDPEKHVPRRTFAAEQPPAPPPLEADASPKPRRLARFPGAEMKPERRERLAAFVETEADPSRPASQKEPGRARWTPPGVSEPKARPLARRPARSSGSPEERSDGGEPKARPRVRRLARSVPSPAERAGASRVRAEEDKAPPSSREPRGAPDGSQMGRAARTPGPGPMEADPGPRTLFDIGFRQAGGISRVYVRLDGRARFRELKSPAPDTFVLKLMDTSVDVENNARPLDTSFFPGPVTLVEVKRFGTATHIEVRLRQAARWAVKRIGTTLAVDFVADGS